MKRRVLNGGARTNLVLPNSDRIILTPLCQPHCASHNAGFVGNSYRASVSHCLRAVESLAELALFYPISAYFPTLFGRLSITEKQIIDTLSQETW
jgi:hypothetical protein